jgi:hypothetical protein
MKKATSSLTLSEQVPMTFIVCERPHRFDYNATQELENRENEHLFGWCAYVIFLDHLHFRFVVLVFLAYVHAVETFSLL